MNDKILNIFAFCVLVFFFSCNTNTQSESGDSTGETTETENSTENGLGTAVASATALRVVNNTNGALTIYVTSGGASVTNCSSNFVVADLPFLTPAWAGNTTQGFFSLAASDTMNFPALSKCYNGVISVTAGPHCKDSNFPNGMNQAEFSLNMTSGGESIDVSCVNGVNAYLEMAYDGTGWTNSPGSIANSDLGDNKGRLGVYPLGCTQCNALGNPTPDCGGHPTMPTNSDNCNTVVCQLNRNNSGGTITVNVNASPPS